MQSSVNDAKQDGLENGTKAINVNSDLGKEDVSSTEDIQIEDVLAEIAREPSKADEEDDPMNYESTGRSNNLTDTNENGYEKILSEGKVFHSYDEFLCAIKKYGEASHFRLSARDSSRCKDSDLDRNQFPKKWSRFVCQAGQRERFKAGFRQRRKSDKLIEKTGCPVGLSINLQDTDQHGIGYVVTKFNHSDHNHLPRKK